MQKGVTVTILYQQISNYLFFCNQVYSVSQFAECECNQGLVLLQELQGHGDSGLTFRSSKQDQTKPLAQTLSFINLIWVSDI